MKKKVWHFHFFGNYDKSNHGCIWQGLSIARIFLSIGDGMKKHSLFWHQLLVTSWPSQWQVLMLSGFSTLPMMYVIIAKVNFSLQQSMQLCYIWLGMISLSDMSLMLALLMKTVMILQLICFAMMMRLTGTTFQKMNHRFCRGNLHITQHQPSIPCKAQTLNQHINQLFPLLVVHLQPRCLHLLSQWLASGQIWRNSLELPLNTVCTLISGQKSCNSVGLLFNNFVLIAYCVYIEWIIADFWVFSFLTCVVVLVEIFLWVNSDFFPLWRH